MKKLYFFDREKTYVFPDSNVGTPEVNMQKYPGAFYSSMKYVVTSDEEGTMMYGMDPLSTLKSHYHIDSSLSDDEALAAIEEIINTPPEIDTTPSPEERIAAALEFQALSSLPDEE